MGYSYGPGAHGSLSGSAVHPATVAGPAGAMAHGPVMYLELVNGAGGDQKRNFRYEDQLGSLIGMADLLGNKLVDYVYLDYGRPVERRVLVDGRAGWISDASADTPLPGITTLEMDAASLGASTDELAGMQLYISLPYETADRIRVGTVLWNDAGTLWVEDPDDLIHDALDPMGGIEADWVIYDLRANIADTARAFTVVGVFGGTVETDPVFLGNEIGWVVQGDSDPATIVDMTAPSKLLFDFDQTLNLTPTQIYVAERPGDWNYATTAGVWTAAPSFGSGVTTLTSADARFETFMEGWLIAPDAGCTTHGFAYLEILEVTGSDSLTVKGDLTTMLAGDERFWIFAPPSVDAQTGATRGTYTGSTFKPAKCDSRYLWAQYRYMPPMAGYEVNPGTPGIYGRQPGTNQTGTYHAWNRQYDPGTGRWTTPDPAASPWGNLFRTIASGPIRAADPSGLEEDAEEKARASARKIASENDFDESDCMVNVNFWEGTYTACYASCSAFTTTQQRTACHKNCHDAHGVHVIAWREQARHRRQVKAQEKRERPKERDTVAELWASELAEIAEEVESQNEGESLDDYAKRMKERMGKKVADDGTKELEDLSGIACDDPCVTAAGLLTIKHVMANGLPRDSKGCTEAWTNVKKVEPGKALNACILAQPLRPKRDEYKTSDAPIRACENWLKWAREQGK